VTDEPAARGASATAGDRPPAADEGHVPSDDGAAPSLVWPPLEDELNEWEVLHIQSTGQNIIEPMRSTPPADAAAPPAAEQPTFTPPPTPYVPPEPIEDPAGETSLVPVSNDPYLPETELIEPLIEPASAPDDRTVVMSRPAGVTHKPELPAPASVAPPASPLPSQEETNVGVGTKILVAPAFAASVGHAPTVPVSALHRGPRPQPAFGPRHSMEDTLPAGVTREMLVGDRAGDQSDETIVRPGPRGDTRPVPIARRAAAGPAGPPRPFSRVPSRASLPVSPDPVPEPVPISLAPPPLAFGPRVPASGSSGSAPSIAPVPFPVPAPGPREVAVPSRPAPTSTRSRLLVLGGLLALVLLLGLGVYQVLSMRNTAAGAPTLATLSVESSPAGALVSIDGTPRGKTPLRLELGEGKHALDVSLGGATRHVPLTLAAGTITAHSFEFAPPPAPAAADAAIEIRSEPAGGRVVVDGVARGTTPVVVRGLTAGRHEIQVGGPFRTVTRTVTLGAGQQALLVVTPARTATPPSGESRDERPARASADTGYVSIQSPIPLRVVRNGDFVGTSEDARLSLPAGPQVIGLENESVGFRDVRTVEVVAGKVTPVSVSLPKGEISINARPWAEVFVDGNRVGETPVSQLSLPVGIHEVVFRHPELGERRVSVIVKIGATGRAFTDFTK
jgi:hypothetical protein